MRRASISACLFATAMSGGCLMEVVDVVPIADAGEDEGEVSDDEAGDEAPAEQDEGGSGQGGEDGAPLFDVGSGSSQVSTCEFADQFPSHIGCEFFAIDPDLAGLHDEDPYVFAVINPLDEPVEVELSRRNDQSWAQVEQVTIPAQQVYAFEPGDNHAPGTGVFLSAVFRLTSTAPVVAVQFSGGYKSSATMLQPSAAWTPTTHVAGWRTHEGVGERAFMGIVARSSGTTVKLASSFDVFPNTPTAWDVPDPLPDDPDFNELELELQPGALARLDAKATEAEVDHGTSGTSVVTGQEHLNSVFSVHTCAAIPDYDGGCGHMQEQLVSRLEGQHFVVPRMVLFSDPNQDLADVHEETMVQVVATQPETTVYFLHGDGEVLESVVIDPADPYAVYEAERELIVIADRPVVASAYMTNPKLTSLGSPSMVQLAPVEQWTGMHYVWVPEGYETHLLIASLAGAQLDVEQVATLDGQPLPADPHAYPVAVHGVFADELGQREVTRVPVAPGLFRVTSHSPSSVVVAGWRSEDGFAYLGGWGPSLADLGPAG